MDDRIIQRLEEQLSEAHATNSELRELVADVEKREQAARAIQAEGEVSKRQLEKAYADKKAAEQVANASRRKQEDAERDAARALEKLAQERELLEAVREEARQLSALNARVAEAKHVGDLFRTNEQQER